ncbi:molybdopterin-dependent oxidoreductase [Pseudooceanicola sp. 216_PA32_1]|uniref:Molybdopterin-dependent oxidoreductase n=1 Tax=Pseudooceanicola pacificus TaxID=2676438 RepID=A0A844W3J9_9RHOB|nr:molybdopterin-dependent oxidoreductase [Pseudooceanicola pacificus]MWB77284.1 molybdopterin-dependent oxidoreductase [Pseudooceanicola pacificus]
MIRTASAPAIILAILCLALPGWADLPRASGPVILTITKNGEETAALDRQGLEGLPVSDFTTTTIWTDGPQTFRGVRLAALLERLEVRDGTLSLVAANGYAIRIAVADIRPDGALLAYQRNGAPMSLRDKGPLWLVYPYDSDPSFRTEVKYANSIWQLDQIDIIP